MSDRRRRRRKNSGEESEEENADRSEVSDHEYESAAEADHSPDSESEEAGSEDGKEGGEQTESTDLKDTETNQEIQAAKGEKSSVEEDRRNPAYIPKRGLYYEHDDRLESGDEEEIEDSEKPGLENEEDGGEKEAKTPSKDQKPRRVYKADAAEKWGHDKFLDLEQAPKTKEELVSVYGYDIRNEDNAPRARRRRRYGRGPNKYTRNWEDEDAYQAKPARGKLQPSRGRGLRKMGEGDSAEELSSPAQTPQRSERSSQQGDFVEKPPRSRADPDERSQRGATGRGGRGRGGPQSRRGTSEQTNSRGVDSPRSSRGGNNSRKPVDQAAEAKLDNVENSLSKVTLNRESTIKKSDGDRPAEASTGPNASHQSESKPKRYSNLRPGRTDPSGEPRKQQFYDYQQQHGGDSIQFRNQAFPNTPNNGPPPDAPFLTTPTQTAGGPRVAIPTPAGASAPYINSASGIINYGPPPPVAYGAVPVTVPIPLVGVAATPHHPPADPIALMAAASHLNQVPAYVAANPVVAVSTNDQALLAQVHGGVTYFNPTAQAHVPMRSQVSKRPKAAIPIVDPSQIDQIEGHQRQVNGDAKVAEAQLQLEPTAANT